MNGLVVFIAGIVPDCWKIPFLIGVVASSIIFSPLFQLTIITLQMVPLESYDIDVVSTVEQGDQSNNSNHSHDWVGIESSCGLYTTSKVIFQ